MQFIFLDFIHVFYKVPHHHVEVTKISYVGDRWNISYSVKRLTRLVQQRRFIRQSHMEYFHQQSQISWKHSMYV